MSRMVGGRGNVSMATDEYEYVDTLSYGDDKDAIKNASCSVTGDVCKDGLLIPMWMPQGNISDAARYLRALLYISALIYLFLGVAVVTERFMTAIDVIISQRKQVAVMIPDGTTIFVSERVWSETVANLTLVALGSSASEILLSIIEVCGHDFQAGDLGPGTIIGRAAYSLFVICAICVFAVPVKKVRRIKRLSVFSVTAAWSVFAYIWLFIILLVTSKGVIEIWEAVLTCIFFPVTVYTSYLAEKWSMFGKHLGRDSDAIYETTKELHKVSSVESIQDSGENKGSDEENSLLRTVVKQRNQITSIISKLREMYPYADLAILSAMAKNEIINMESKSKAFYAGTRKRSSWAEVLKETDSYPASNVAETFSDVTKVFFDSDTYAVMESTGIIKLSVLRRGGDLTRVCHVDYSTEDGSAKKVVDYVEANGTLIFQPLQRRAQIAIQIISDDVVEDDEVFYVRLSNPGLNDPNDEAVSAETNKIAPELSTAEVKNIISVSTPKAVEHEVIIQRPTAPADAPTGVILGSPAVAAVTIVDDSHPGIFYFPTSALIVEEDRGDIPVKVYRAKGGKGRIRLPYHAVDGAAQHGEHYQLFGSDVIFENQEHEKIIMIRIINKERYTVKLNFTLVLDEPEMLHEDLDYKRSHARKSGSIKEETNNNLIKATLGTTSVLTVSIEESKTFKNAVDDVLRMNKPSQMARAATWSQQFNDAISVNAADGDYTYVDIELPTLGDYVFHFLSLVWKLLAALVPPTKYCNGWACFFACIVELGILTTIIGDLAASLGCTIGLKDSFTAIYFVAIGASLPDTFSSKLAAISEKTADVAIGNVPACNAVNIFLGLGIAWTPAAIHHGLKGKKFLVPSDCLALLAIFFFVLSFLAISLLLSRRRSSVGGELGGPSVQRIMTVVVLITLWIVYLIISTLIIYCVLRI